MNLKRVAAFLAFLFTIAPFASHGSEVNGVFMKDNCNWFALSEEENLMALLYLSDQRSRNGELPFIISFHVDWPLDSSANDKQLMVNIEVDGKELSAVALIKVRKGYNKTLLVFYKEFFAEMNRAFKKGNVLKLKHEQFETVSFSLKGYTKTANALKKQCNKK